MSEVLSNTHIALLCDIAQSNRTATPDDRKPDVEYLTHAGYVTMEDGGLQLTEKASSFLSARGATLNEA